MFFAKPTGALSRCFLFSLQFMLFFSKEMSKCHFIVDSQNNFFELLAKDEFFVSNEFNKGN